MSLTDLLNTVNGVADKVKNLTGSSSVPQAAAAVQGANNNAPTTQTAKPVSETTSGKSNAMPSWLKWVPIGTGGVVVVGLLAWALSGSKSK